MPSGSRPRYYSAESVRERRTHLRSGNRRCCPSQDSRAGLPEERNWPKHPIPVPGERDLCHPLVKHPHAAPIVDHDLESRWCPDRKRTREPDRYRSDALQGRVLQPCTDQLWRLGSCSQEADTGCRHGRASRRSQHHLFLPPEEPVLRATVPGGMSVGKSHQRLRQPMLGGPLRRHPASGV